MTVTDIISKPIDRVLNLLPDAKRPNPSGFYTTLCKAHNDTNASLSFKPVGNEDSEDGEGITFTCFSGCTRESILNSIGLTEEDMHYRAPGIHTQHTSKMKRTPILTTWDLGVDKLIHPNLLLLWGIADGECTYHKNKDGSPYTKKGVIIPYFTQDGRPYSRYRLRTELTAKKGTFWNEGTDPTIPYGLEKLDMARKAGYLVIVEGESDCWTLWRHNMPAMGIPGATNYKVMKLEYLKGIEQIHIIKEPGTAGESFAFNVASHLTNIGYKGGISIIDLQNMHQAKDPNDLHKKDVNAFPDAFRQAIQQAHVIRKPRTKPTLQRLSDLMLEVLPEMKWAIEPILPEGLTILAGKPKLGKSWLALNILISIASGSIALSRYPVEQGEVLYVDLEDGKKRLQNRANTVLSNDKVPHDFYYITECPRVDDGGLEFLTETINEHPRLRLICIDTWARFKPKPVGRAQKVQYDEDYDALQPLQKLASEKGISIIVVDHMRKMESDDPLDMISGSVGKTGAVDGFLLLYRKRQETDANLFVFGRDIEEESELELEFSKECASWVVKRDVNDTSSASTPERQAILNLLSGHDQGLKCEDIAKSLDNKNINTTRNLLVKLRIEGKVNLQNNRYSVVSVVSHSNHSNHSNHSKGYLEASNESEFTMPYYGVTTQDKLTTLTMVTTHMPASEWNISSNRSEEQLQSDEEFRQREWESTHPTYTFQVGQTVKYNRETCTVFKVMPELIMVEGRSNRPIRIEAKDFHLVKVIGK